MASEDAGRALTSLRRKRGVIKRSITRLVNSLKTLEATPDAPGTVAHAKQLVMKLEGFDKDFRAAHFEIVDLFAEDKSEDLEREHEVLDKHEDDMTATSLRLQRLITLAPGSVDSGSEKPLSRKLGRVQRHLEETGTALSIAEGHDDIPLLEQH